MTLSELPVTPRTSSSSTSTMFGSGFSFFTQEEENGANKLPSTLYSTTDPNDPNPTKSKDALRRPSVIGGDRFNVSYTSRPPVTSTSSAPVSPLMAPTNVTPTEPFTSAHLQDEMAISVLSSKVDTEMLYRASEWSKLDASTSPEVWQHDRDRIGSYASILTSTSGLTETIGSTQSSPLVKQQPSPPTMDMKRGTASLPNTPTHPPRKPSRATTALNWREKSNNSAIQSTPITYRDATMGGTGAMYVTPPRAKLAPKKSCARNLYGTTITATTSTASLFGGNAGRDRKNWRMMNEEEKSNFTAHSKLNEDDKFISSISPTAVITSAERVTIVHDTIPNNVSTDPSLLLSSNSNSISPSRSKSTLPRVPSVRLVTTVSSSHAPSTPPRNPVIFVLLSVLSLILAVLLDPTVGALMWGAATLFIGVAIYAVYVSHHTASPMKPLLEQTMSTAPALLPTPSTQPRPFPRSSTAPTLSPTSASTLALLSGKNRKPVQRSASSRAAT